MSSLPALTQSARALRQQPLTADTRAHVHAVQRWVETQSDVPRTQDGKVPYLDDALDYTSPVQLDFARALRAEGVRLLREQEGL